MNKECHSDVTLLCLHKNTIISTVKKCIAKKIKKRYYNCG